MPIQNLNVAAQANEVAGSGAVGSVVASKPASASSVQAKVKPVEVELPPVAAKQPPSIVQLQRLIDGMNKAMQQSNSSLEFSMDSSSKKIMVRLIDTTTGDIIRQIPSEEMLAISQSIEKMQQGLLLNKNA